MGVVSVSVFGLLLVRAFRVYYPTAALLSDLSAEIALHSNFSFAVEFCLDGTFSGTV